MCLSCTCEHHSLLRSTGTVRRPSVSIVHKSVLCTNQSFLKFSAWYPKHMSAESYAMVLVPACEKATVSHVRVIPPKHVTIHRKKMEVNWDRLDPRLQCVDGLDDIMRFDLQHFCRRMQPPEEPHYRSAQQSSMSHVVSCRVMSCRVVSCRVMSCHVMSCHVACWSALGIHIKCL